MVAREQLIGCCALLVIAGCARSALLPLEPVCRPGDIATVCRPATHSCDAPEVCDGVAPECPPDETMDDGIICPTGLCQGGACQAPITTQSVLEAPNPGFDNKFGDSFVLGDDFLAVGAPLSDVVDVDAGIVYLFAPDSNGDWHLVGPLAPSTHGANDAFGEDLALSGNRLAVGADGRQDVVDGYVQLFVREQGVWVEEARVPNPGDITVSASIYGNRVALEEDTLVVQNVTNTFIYQRGTNGWVLHQTLPRGGRIAVDGDNLVFCDIDNPNREGRAFVYQRVEGNWQAVTELVAPTPEDADFFCYGLTLRDDWILVGASNYDGTGPANSGRVFAYQKSGDDWVYRQTLTSGVPQLDGHFGVNVELSADGRAIVGAAGMDNAAVAGGAIYIFELDGASWAHATVLLPDPVSPNDKYGNGDLVLFGQWVAFSGEDAAVGAVAEAGRVILRFLP